MKDIAAVRCIVPFTMLSVHNHGYCYSCCPAWTTIGTVGRLTNDNSIMEIWNNQRMRYIRQSVLDDQLWRICNFRYCPYAIKKEYMNLEALKNNDRNFNHIIDRIMTRRTIMDKPPYIFEVAHSGKCNLKCVMCQSYTKYSKNVDDLFDEKLFSKIIPEILPDTSRLFLTGNGEVFFSAKARKFLRSLNSSRFPLLKVDLLTNGTLFTPKLWDSIRHNRYESISVSIDAASQPTYERIRKNGNWNILQRNLDFISKLRRQKVMEHFSITFIVMKSNYQEMKQFVEIGVRLGCDKIVFQKIFGFADIRENINFTANKKIFTAIAEILMDPIFSRQDVDTTLIDEYRKYSGKKVFLWDMCFTRIKEWLLYIPIKVLLSVTQYFSCLQHFYTFLRRKNVSLESVK